MERRLSGADTSLGGVEQALFAHEHWVATPTYVNSVAYLSLASKEVANGYTPYHKFHKLGILYSPGSQYIYPLMMLIHTK